ncbi:hypothetical protein Hanom_Chr09g00796781 [Helianthus anomalus]
MMTKGLIGKKCKKEYEEARSYGRWDKKRECYINRKGDPVVDSSKVVYSDVLAVIPLSGEYYSKIEADKDYLKKLDKIIRDVMTSSLKKRDEERMKQKVENLVDELKKTAEEGSGEQKNEEVKEKEAVGEESQKPAEEAIAEKQQDDESLKKKEEVAGKESQKTADENLEKSVGEAVAEEQQVKEEDQKQTAKEAEVPKTECKKCMETCSAGTEKDEKFRTRDMEFSKNERVFIPLHYFHTCYHLSFFILKQTQTIQTQILTLVYCVLYA